jgi:hypothetical protein
VTTLGFRAATSRILGVSASAGDLAHTHLVAVYDRNAELTATVAEFLSDAIEGRGTAVVIATLAHRRAIASALESRGVALDDLVCAGRYRSIDARDALDAFMREGHPDPEAFMDVVSDLIASSSAAGSPVHVFGEMIALLWDDGNVAAALDLESLWNRAANRAQFTLLCAYGRGSLERGDDLASAKGMCDRHSAVLPLITPIDPATPTDPPRPDPDVCRRLFVAAPTAPQEARAFVRHVLEGWGEGAREGEAEIIASELATNAVRHARSPFCVSVTRTPAAIRIAVRDASSDHPRRIVRDDCEYGGRGIRLVAALSIVWGTTAEADGKTVWADVARA